MENEWISFWSWGILSLRAYTQWRCLESMRFNHQSLFLVFTSINIATLQADLTEMLAVPRVYIGKSLPPSSLMGISSSIKLQKVHILNSQAYQLPESSSNGIPNLYSGMERTAQFRWWCGEEKEEGRAHFLLSNEGSSPSCRALGLIFPDWQKYISLWLSISRLTALHSQSEAGEGRGVSSRGSGNSHLTFSLKAVTDTQSHCCQ